MGTKMVTKNALRWYYLIREIHIFTYQMKGVIQKLNTL